jgi:lipopolysaccharide/colanic/teichoic acid biosynthesis glycosyltransferase
MKRSFDIGLALAGLLVLAPLFVVIATLIALSSRGGVLYRQERIGRGGIPFTIYKFRTMRTGSDRHGLLTIGAADCRVTCVGYFLRKFKLDELPQLYNVLVGDMSIVGPRPEVARYVDRYDARQLEVLQVRPGLTDFASLAFIHENDVLAASAEPEKTYIHEVMPRKLLLNRRYIQQQCFWLDVKIVMLTLCRIVGLGQWNTEPEIPDSCETTAEAYVHWELCPDDWARRKPLEASREFDFGDDRGELRQGRKMGSPSMTP